MKKRYEIVDFARGLAVVAMIAYHFTWDLSNLGLIAANIVAEPAWQWFARSIAGSFLVLVGIGLHLAHGQAVKPRSFFRRFSKIALAAVAVSLATRIAFPDSYIFFGILHCIALSSLLALPFLRVPALVICLAAAFCIVAPTLFTSASLDAPYLDWLGLGLSEPRTNDYVPIFPWFGLVLIGLSIGRLLTRHAATFHVAIPGGTALLWAGRHSLPIYLLHQVVLFGALSGLVYLIGPNPIARARPFQAQCVAQCLEQNSNAALCRSACACVVADLAPTPAFERIIQDRVLPEDRLRISQSAQACLKRSP